MTTFKETAIFKIKSFISSSSTSLIAFTLSIVTGSIIVWFMGYNPIDVYSSLFSGAFGSLIALTGTLNRTFPIILAGLAIAFGQKSGVFNIGVEGQIVMGTFTSLLVGLFIDLPSIIHIPLMFIAGAIGGMAWAFIPALLRYTKNVNIVFSTIMFNHIAAYLSVFLLALLPGHDTYLASSAMIDETAMLPDIAGKPFEVSSGLIIALGIAVLVYIYLFKSRGGYRLRAVGLNQSAARSAGINVPVGMFKGMMISGGIAGMVGAIDLMGLSFRMPDRITTGYMATGIAVAMLGRGNPFGIVIASLLFAAMRNGSAIMQISTGLTGQFVSVVQGLIIIFICSENIFKWINRKIKERAVKAE